MNKSIFEYSQYRAFFNDFIASQPQNGWGMQAKIAKFLGVHTTFVSQVLKGQLELNQEQAIQLSEFMSLSEVETEYFLLLVNYNRAGTHRLKNYYKKLVAQKVQQHYQLSKRLDSVRNLTKEELKFYYSAWEISAVDLCSTLPHIKSVEDIASYLGIERHVASDAVDYLASTGLIKREGGRFVSGNTRVHVGDENRTEMIQNHINWRLKAIESVKKIHPLYQAQRLNWSATITLSKSDVHVLREELWKCIQKIREVVKKSDEEVAYCYTIDLFPLCADALAAPQVSDLVKDV